MHNGPESPTDPTLEMPSDDEDPMAFPADPADREDVIEGEVSDSP